MKKEDLKKRIEEAIALTKIMNEKILNGGMTSFRIVSTYLIDGSPVHIYYDLSKNMLEFHFENSREYLV